MSADDDKAKAFVIDTLALREIAAIDFQLYGINISPSMYQQVSKAVVNGQIAVLVLPDGLKAQEAAKYFPELDLPNGDIFFNIFAFRSPDRGGAGDERLKHEMAIVHESTHAGFDLLKVQNMTHAVDEACAYAAEAIFRIARMPALGGDPDRVIIADAIRKAAWDFGRLVQRSKANSANAYYKSIDFAAQYGVSSNTLISAIANSDEYKREAKLPANNVGVGRQWVLHGSAH